MVSNQGFNSTPPECYNRQSVFSTMLGEGNSACDIKQETFIAISIVKHCGLDIGHFQGAVAGQPMSFER